MLYRYMQDAREISYVFFIVELAQLARNRSLRDGITVRGKEAGAPASGRGRTVWSGTCPAARCASVRESAIIRGAAATSTCEARTVAIGPSYFSGSGSPVCSSTDDTMFVYSTATLQYVSWKNTYRMTAEAVTAKNSAVRNCASGKALSLLPLRRSLNHVSGIKSTGTQQLTQTMDLAVARVQGLSPMRDEMNDLDQVCQPGTRTHSNILKKTVGS